ncbi:MAG: hypothetical protein ACRDUY_16660 [Nitriliruptorales bacterium]
MLSAAFAATLVAIPATAAAQPEIQPSQTSDDGDVESSSEAAAVEVDGVAVVSGTEASTQDDGSASATAVGLGDEQVVGGSQEGEGESGDAVFSTGETENGHLHVLTWQAAVDDEGSSARSAAVDGNVGGDEGLSLVVLEANSNARRDGSSGDSSGARLNAGGDEGLTLVLLHAAMTSGGDGGAFLAGINDERIGTDEDFGGGCEIDASPLVHLICVAAREMSDEQREELLPGSGDGGSGSEAFIADIEAVDGNLLGGLFTAGAAQAPEDAPPAAPAAAGGPGEPPSEAPSEGGALPLTGGGTLWMLLGVLTSGAGVALRRWIR